MVLFVEWHYLRTGDELYRTLARRWRKVMLALFAPGDHGKDPQPRDGPLRPEFTATFGSVSWLGFVIEGFSFFVEGIFIGIYVYGWERLVSRLHLRSGIPVVSAAATSAAAGTVQMGADPHWRVRRPPPDLRHQLVTQRESGAIST